MDKELLVDAVVGKGFTSLSDAIEMQERGLAYFSGNQHNEKWDWDRVKLRELDEAQLQQLYARNNEGDT